jgi:hypothetical protein
MAHFQLAEETYIYIYMTMNFFSITKRWLATANAVRHLRIVSTLKMEVTYSCQTSVLARPIRRHIPENNILPRHRRENL